MVTFRERRIAARNQYLVARAEADAAYREWRAAGRERSLPWAVFWAVAFLAAGFFLGGGFMIAAVIAAVWVLIGPLYRALMRRGF